MPRVTRVVTAAMYERSHQRFEDRHLRRVRAGRPAFHRVAHHDVVEHVDVVVADLLDGSSQVHDALGTFAIGDAGELDG